MKPSIHALIHAKKFGGVAADYLAINQMMDSSKSTIADNRHRAIFHNAFGPFIMEKIFGTTITNTDGKAIAVREIAEQHIIEDMGFIPTVQDYLQEMQYQPWMHGQGKPASQAKLAPKKRRNEVPPEEVQNTPEEVQTEIEDQVVDTSRYLTNPLLKQLID